MPLLNTVTKIAAKPFPRVISPRTHAVIDYMTVGSFFMSAIWFWKRSKRAVIAALISGGADLGVSLMTNYPGGVMKAISFRAHRNIDFGLAAMTATLPEFLAFKGDRERKFFLAQGAMITAVTELTEEPTKKVRPERRAA